MITEAVECVLLSLIKIVRFDNTIINNLSGKLTCMKDVQLANDIYSKKLK